MSVKLSEKQAECLRVIESVPFVDFSTIDKDGFPSTRLMMNLRNKTQFSALALYDAEERPLTVYLTTHDASEKMAEIQKNPKANLYFFNQTTFSAVLLMGTVEIVTEAALREKAWQKEWEKHYPNPDEGYALLRFFPTKLKACIGHTTFAESF